MISLRRFILQGFGLPLVIVSLQGGLASAQLDLDALRPGLDLSKVQKDISFVNKYFNSRFSLENFDEIIRVGAEKKHFYYSETYQRNLSLIEFIGISTSSPTLELLVLTSISMNQAVHRPFDKRKLDLVLYDLFHSICISKHQAFLYAAVRDIAYESAAHTILNARAQENKSLSEAIDAHLKKTGSIVGILNSEKLWAIDAEQILLHWAKYLLMTEDAHQFRLLTRRNPNERHPKNGIQEFQPLLADMFAQLRIYKKLMTDIFEEWENANSIYDRQQIIGSVHTFSQVKAKGVSILEVLIKLNLDTGRFPRAANLISIAQDGLDQAADLATERYTDDRNHSQNELPSVRTEQNDELSTPSRPPSPNRSILKTSFGSSESGKKSSKSISWSEQVDLAVYKEFDQTSSPILQSSQGWSENAPQQEIVFGKFPNREYVRAQGSKPLVDRSQHHNVSFDPSTVDLLLSDQLPRQRRKRR